jgi:hypothetical protein
MGCVGGSLPSTHHSPSAAGHIPRHCVSVAAPNIPSALCSCMLSLQPGHLQSPWLLWSAARAITLLSPPDRYAHHSPARSTRPRSLGVVRGRPTPHSRPLSTHFRQTGVEPPWPCALRQVVFAEANFRCIRSLTRTAFMQGHCPL